MKFRFNQAEGLIGQLIDETVDSLEELDALAVKAARILVGEKCYFKCDIYVDGKRFRFDLCPAMGVGVDDIGRTPSLMLKRWGAL